MTALAVASVNVDALDPERLAAFWAAATGGTITGRHEDFVFVSPPRGQPLLRGGEARHGVITSLPCT